MEKNFWPNLKISWKMEKKLCQKNLKNLEKLNKFFAKLKNSWKEKFHGNQQKFLENLQKFSENKKNCPKWKNKFLGKIKKLIRKKWKKYFGESKISKKKKIF